VTSCSPRGIQVTQFNYISNYNWHKHTDAQICIDRGWTKLSCIREIKLFYPIFQYNTSEIKEITYWDFVNVDHQEVLFWTSQKQKTMWLISSKVLAHIPELMIFVSKTYQQITNPHVCGREKAARIPSFNRSQRWEASLENTNQLNWFSRTFIQCMYMMD